MAIILTATESIDEREIEISARGVKGKRVYRVNSGLIDVAVFGNGSGRPIGLPAKGDAWNVALVPYLAVVGFRPKRQGGENTDLSNITGGWTLVEVIYETPSWGGGAPPPAPGTKFTKIETSVTTTQALYAIDPATGEVPPGSKQINGGAGTPRDTGLLGYSVYVALSKTQFANLNISTILDLHQSQAVNSNAVDLPPFLSSSSFHSFAIGQLRFTGFEVMDPDEDGDRYVVYHLKAAKDHLVPWVKEGPDGDSVGTKQLSHIYPRKSFAGLW